MSPTLERIEIPPLEMAGHLRTLETHYLLPDGTEVTDHHAMKRYRKQISQGYYLRLVFTNGETPEQIREWYSNAELILMWRKLGALPAPNVR